MSDRIDDRRVVLTLGFALVAAVLVGMALSGAVTADSEVDRNGIVDLSSGGEALADSFEVQNEEPLFVVEIQETNSPVMEGDTLLVEATVVNKGDGPGEQDVRLAIDDARNVVDRETVTLRAGQSRTITLGWDTDSGGAGSYQAGVVSDDDDSVVGVEVREPEPANFEVNIDGTNEPVTEGDPLEVTATIENTGDVEDTQEVELLVNGAKEDGHSITLSGGESTTETFTWSETEAGEYRASVSSHDSSGTVSGEIQEPEPANFEVNIDGTNEPVTEGDPLEVTVTIENTGDEGAEQEVGLAIDGNAEDSKAVSLNGGESTTETLTWTDTEEGSFTASVRTGDDGDSQTVRIDERQPANFEISIDSTNSPVTEGDPLEVTATIENTGDEGAEQEVGLLIDGNAEDSGVVGLNGGESTTETFTWTDTEEGSFTASVRTGDDGDSQTVHVEADEPEPFFEVDILRTNSPVEEGETFGVAAEITNTGDDAGGQEITLEIDGSVVDDTGVRLGPDDSQTVELGWDTEEGEAGDYRAIVASEDDAAGTTVHVESDEPTPATFDVEILDTNSPVEEGETLAVAAEITNTGDEGARQEIVLEIDDEVVDGVGIGLDAGESEEIRLAWETEAGDDGRYEATVSSHDDSDTTSVGVREDADSPYFEVDILGTNSPVTEGDDLTFRVEVENVGDEPGEQEITLEIDGLGESAAETVTLDGGESTSLELSVGTGAGDAGTYGALVSSEDSGDRASVDVRSADEPDPATFDVSIVETNSPVSSGETLEVTAEVENSGDESGDQRIDLILDGEVRDNAEVRLGGGDGETVTFEWRPGPGDVGEFDLAVVSEDDRDATTVMVVDEGFVVSDLRATSPVSPGETIQVQAEITNVGEEGATQEIQLRLAGADVRNETTTELRLAGGDSDTVTWETEAGQSGTYEVTVETEDHTASEQVRVESETPDEREGDDTATFTVRIDSVERADDGTIQVEATVENTGDVEDTQNVVLSHNGADHGSQELTLAGGESDSVSFSLTPDDNLDLVDLEVASETDSDTSSLELDEGETDEADDDADEGISLTASTLPYLLILLLALLVGFYYVRRRRIAEDDPADYSGDGQSGGGQSGSGGSGGGQSGGGKAGGGQAGGGQAGGGQSSGGRAGGGQAGSGGSLSKTTGGQSTGGPPQGGQSGGGGQPQRNQSTGNQPQGGHSRRRER